MGCDMVYISGEIQLSLQEVIVQMAVRSNLRVLHSLKEAQAGRRIFLREVGEATGMTDSQISRYLNDRIDLFHRDTLDRLCVYYDCKPGDILIRTDEEPILEGVA
jgi:DNA-binding Xre family transcriptional regulator